MKHYNFWSWQSFQQSCSESLHVQVSLPSPLSKSLIQLADRFFEWRRFIPWTRPSGGRVGAHYFVIVIFRRVSNIQQWSLFRSLSTAMDEGRDWGGAQEFISRGPALPSRLPLSLHSHVREEKKGRLCNPVALACTLVPAATSCKSEGGCRALVTPAAFYLCLAGSNSGSKTRGEKRGSITE